MESADSIPELLNRIILTSSPKSSKKTQNYLRQRDKVKITDQSKVLFEQKRWFKTKKNDRVASRLEMGLSFKWKYIYHCWSHFNILMTVFFKGDLLCKLCKSNDQLRLWPYDKQYFEYHNKSMSQHVALLVIIHSKDQGKAFVAKF